MNFHERIQSDDLLRRRLITAAFVASVCFALLYGYSVLTGNGLSERDRFTFEHYPFSAFVSCVLCMIPAFMTGGLLYHNMREHSSSQTLWFTETGSAPQDLQPAPLVNLSFQIPTPEQRGELHRLMVEADRYSRMARNLYLLFFCFHLSGIFGIARLISVFESSLMSWIDVNRWRRGHGMLEFSEGLTQVSVLFGAVLLSGIILLSCGMGYAAFQMLRRHKAIRSHLAELLKTSPHPCLIENTLHYFQRRTDAGVSEALNNIAKLLHSMSAEQITLCFANYRSAFKPILRAACSSGSNPNLVRATLHAVDQLEETSLLPVVRYVANRSKGAEVRREARECALRLEAIAAALDTSETLLRPAYAIPASELLRPAFASKETQESLKLLLKPSDSLQGKQ